jgi:ribosomal protein S18 acetylase RimI-like enzyme
MSVIKMNLPPIEHKNLFIDLLCDSFEDNKSVNYVVKQDEHRKRRIRSLMDYSYETCRAFGDVWMADDLQACALVLYPDKKKFTFRSAIWDARLALSSVGINRVGIVLKRQAAVKSFHPTQPFTYLWFIAVSKEAQGSGRGTRLLERIIHKSDVEGRPIYLETSVEQNLQWYKKHGFEIFNEIDFSYHLYMMRRNLDRS